ncbi:LysM peptidoglycan-binding domain-containing protein [Flavobacterium jejuense]|uniref:LysM peptidoglycan-binding domain-containing protein n=1 Tax=Flavobacterium jejuense TaxID=1544455 RepID=A0ABX0IN58_9FLAO|nr:C40 family peptidase [Flavobacterium jejuense]NHN25023.1 LysM peptidoglycan-binding domain-containing protein [Flavobacterium jejuense]
MNKIKLITFLLVLINTFAFGQNTLEHKVVAGETIYAIARKYNTSVETIYQLNPKIKGKTLQINAVLSLPTQEENKTLATTEKPQFHKVKKGESFYSISKIYGLSITDLESLNPTIKPNKLKKGTRLNIQKPNAQEVVATEKTQTVEIVANNKEDENQQNEIDNELINKDSIFTVLHIIKRKETKYGVSKQYGISIHELETLNPNLPSDFPVGYQLIIKKDQQVVVAHNSTEQDTTSLSYDEEEMVEKMSNDFNSKADFLVEKASQYIGIKYKYGGTTPKGFDCSGLMCTTFKEIDLSLPRTSSAQANYGEKIKMKESQKGDLIFFATGRKNRISHVGMITEVNEDEIKFIHASTSSGVMISSSKEPYFASRIIQVNRVLNE